MTDGYDSQPDYGAGDADDTDDVEEGLIGALQRIGSSVGAGGRARGVIDPVGRLALPVTGGRALPTTGRGDLAAGGLAATGAAPAQTYEALRRQYQVDLNDERNLGDLEDPGLTDHMRQARQALAEHERERAQLPSVDALSRADVDARRALSAIVTALQELRMGLQCACDDVALQATNVARLRGGEQPHGFPAASPAVPRESAFGRNLDHLARKVGAAEKSLGGLVAAVAGLDRDLTLARRGYEGVVDGQRRRLDDLEESLRVASAAIGAAPAAPAPAAPVPVPAPGEGESGPAGPGASGGL